MTTIQQYINQTRAINIANGWDGSQRLAEYAA